MNYKTKHLTHVTVSVLTHNGSDKTIKTILDIISQKVNNVIIDIIIIDNCSSNDIVNKVNRLFPNITIIENNSNLGFSGGNNIGINQAKINGSNFLFVLNDDIQIKSDYIQEMVNVGIHLNDASVIGSTIILKNRKIQAVSGKMNKFYAGVFWSQKKIQKNQCSVRAVDVIQGAAFMLTKTAMEKGFMFDECLFFGGEEYDLGYWSKISGLKIYVLEHVEVIHDTNQKEIILNRWHPDPVQYYYAIRNNIYVKVKYEKNLFIKIISISLTVSRFFTKGFIFWLKGKKNVILFMIRGFHDGILKKMGMLKSFYIF